MSRFVFRAVVCVCVVAACSEIPALGQAAKSASQLPSLDRTQPPAGPPLTLAAAIAAALEGNPALVVLRRQTDVVRQRPAQSRFLPPPTLSAQVWQWPLNSVNPLDTNMYMLMLEQELPGRGKRDVRASVAERDLEISQNDIAIASRQTVADVGHAYIRLSLARQVADVYVESAGILRRLADVAESKYAAGRISQQDVLKPVVEISKLYDEALVTKAEADVAVGQLNLLMGRSLDSPIGALDDLTVAPALPPMADLLALALAQHPELGGERLNVERTKAELSVARSDAKPDFMVQGGYMLTPRGTDAWLGLIGVTWPSAPWARGRIDARIAETSASVSAAEARVQAADARVRLGVQQAYVKVTTARQRATLLQNTIVPQSRQALEVSRIAYETGRLDFLSVLENQRTLVEEQLRYARALADAADARADLERAVGTDLVGAVPVSRGRTR